VVIPGSLARVARVAQDFLKRFLFKHSLTVSQAGQDSWVFGEVFNEKKRGYFLDIGAHDGVSISNTYLLETRYQWSGICIEANPVTFERLRRNRRAKCLNVCLDHSHGEVAFAMAGVMGGIVGLGRNAASPPGSREVEAVRMRTVPLLRVLQDHQAPRIIDYLSIDVEGAEERVLGGFDFTEFTFRCVTIERPTARLRELFRIHGYALIKEIPNLDCFYVHRTFMKEYRENLFLFYGKKHLSLRLRYWK